MGGWGWARWPRTGRMHPSCPGLVPGTEEKKEGQYPDVHSALLLAELSGQAVLGDLTGAWAPGRSPQHFQSPPPRLGHLSWAPLPGRVLPHPLQKPGWVSSRDTALGCHQGGDSQQQQVRAARTFAGFGFAATSLGTSRRRRGSLWHLHAQKPVTDALRTHLCPLRPPGMSWEGTGPEAHALGLGRAPAQGWWPRWALSLGSSTACGRRGGHWNLS